MEFLELAKKRYSVRAYDNRPVEKEKLDKILEAAHVHTRSVGKSNCPRIICLQTKLLYSGNSTRWKSPSDRRI